MNKNTDLHTKLTPEQMEEALKIINEAWVSMNGEEFGRLCLDKDPHGPSQSWVNENFRRFQNDLGGQINKTSGDYMPKLAAGLVEFYNQHRQPQPYHVLFVDYGNGWEYEFGAYDKSDVVAEQLHIEDSAEHENEIKTKVIKTVSDVRVSDLINELNNPPYYVLAIKSFEEYAVEFGSFDRSEIIEELDHWITQAEHKSVTWDILKTVNDQKEIKKEIDFLNAYGYPKGSMRDQSNWARRDQLTGSAKPATEEKPKSKNVKNEKNVGFGDRNAFQKAAIKVVKEAAKTRKKSGALISEADLVTGATAIMQLVDVECFGADPEHLQIMPASWLFGIMRGESINGGSLPANKVLIETWTEEDPDFEESYKCRNITAPQHLQVIERDLDEIKEEYSGEDLELELESINEIKKSIRG